MENQIYAFYNKLSARYEGVFSYPTDAVTIARLSDPNANFNRNELEVCKVGSIDISTGTVTVTPPIRLDIPEVTEDIKLPVTESK